MARFRNPVPQFLYSDGSPLIRGKLYFYDSNTMIDKNTYADEDLTIANTNPVELTADGRCPNVFYSGNAKVILTDSDDVQLWERDPVTSGEYTISEDTIFLYDHNSDGSHMVYDSVSALRASTLTPFDGQKVSVLGVAAEGDRAGGDFFWDATSTETDNGYVVKLTAITTGRYIRIVDDIITAKMFEAVGDGSTDDYNSLLAADTYLAALPNGAELYLTEGTYKIGTSLSFSSNVLLTLLNGAAITADSGVVVTFGGGFNGLTTQLSGSGSFARTENETSIAQHNAALDRIRTFQAGEFPIRNTPFGFVDAFQDSTGVDLTASTNAAYSSFRTSMVPTRSQANTFYNDDFDNLTAWTDISSGTGAANIVAYTGDPDPAIGSNGVELTSGATIGGIGAIEQDIGTIPNGKFGIMYIATLEQVGSAGSDSLEITLETDGNQMLQIRHRDNAIEVWADGAWQLIFALGGNFSTEWWVNAFDLGTGDHKIDVYAGTENVGTYTGVLPAGTLDGRLTFKQNSGSANNRISQVWITQVGVTQLADNLSLLSVAKEATLEPTRCRLSIYVEDISNVVDPNTNFLAYVSLDDGTTLEAVTLKNQGSMETFENKPIYLFTASHIFTTSGDQTMRYKISLTGNQYISIQGVDMQWE